MGDDDVEIRDARTGMQIAARGVGEERREAERMEKAVARIETRGL